MRRRCYLVGVGVQFSWRWSGGTISLNLGVNWEMSVAEQIAERTAGAAAPRRAFAMGLMVVSSVMISFGGLTIRNIAEADPWQINFYRSLGHCHVWTPPVLQGEN